MIRVEGQGNILSGSMARRYGKEGKKEGSGTADLGNMGESSLGRNEFYFVPGKPKVPQIDHYFTPGQSVWHNSENS